MDDNNQSNFFDDLSGTISKEEADKLSKENQAKGEKIDYLVHKVFEQTEEGKELLDIWREALMMTLTADTGMDNISIGIAEGYKRFIRNIILTVRKVENG